MICPLVCKSPLEKSVAYTLESTNYSFTIHDSIEEIVEFCSEKPAKKSIFLSVDYFRALEKSPPDDLKSRFLLLWENTELIAMFPCQLKLFEAADSIKDLDKDSSSTDVLRKNLAKHVKFNTLIGGNITVSGEYMFCFFKDGFSRKTKFELTEKILDAYRGVLNEFEMKVSMIFIKDFPKLSSLSNLSISNSYYKEFKVEPLMVFEINKAWNNFEDYTNSLTTKYKKRLKTAFKRGKELKYRECDFEEIVMLSDQLYELYINVFKNINFSLFKLSKNYFSVLKENLKDDFRLFIVTDRNDKIVSFYTLIRNNNELHAHFLGYDPEANKEFQLYLNLLYRMIEIGIQEKFEIIDFGRTALEIKSSVGAVPYEYFLYLKHKNKLANFFVQPVINLLNKPTEWIPRSPYADNL